MFDVSPRLRPPPAPCNDDGRRAGGAPPPRFAADRLVLRSVADHAAGGVADGRVLAVAAPARDYRGVAIDVVTEGAEPVFEIWLLHLDPALNARLLSTGSERDAPALWSAVARALSLPRFAARPEGGYVAVDGARAMGRPQRRRRGPVARRMEDRVRTAFRPR